MKRFIITQSGVILLVLGLSIMLIVVIAGSFHIGSSGFGLRKLAILIVGGIVALSGLRELLFPTQTRLDGVLLTVYFLGLLFMGIQPERSKASAMKYFLSMRNVTLNKDLIINILGFSPFGYLMMSYLLGSNRLKNKISAVAVTMLGGITISVGLEIIQYFIPGRHSSLSDWIFNSVGTLLGVCFYLFTTR